MVVAAVLYGVTCVQALYYYTHQNDGWYLQLSVTAVVIFDTIHQALITHTVYTYTITDWGNPDQLQLIVWSLLVEVIFTGLTALIVQGFLTMRIWRLSNRNIYITGTSVILIIGGFVTLIVYVARALQFVTLSSLERVKGESISVNVLGAAADLFIAGMLCSLLNVSRTGFRRSDAIINRLILFTVNTGLLTSLCALASLISILAAPNTYIYIAFFFCLGRLYTNSLLASLNARKVLARVNNRSSEGTTSLSLRDLPKIGQHQAIAVKIDTTQQEYHPGFDRKLLSQDATEENSTVNNTPDLPYDEENNMKVAL